MSDYTAYVETCWGPNLTRDDDGKTFGSVANFGRLNASPDGTKLIYGSGSNIVIREYSSPACSVFSHPTGQVTVGQFSRDGKQIASADSKGVIFLCDFEGMGTPLTPVEKFPHGKLGVSGGVLDLCWFPDNKGIVAGGEKGFKIWPLSGVKVRELAKETRRVASIDVRPAENMHESVVVTGADDCVMRMFTYDKSSQNFSNPKKDESFEKSVDVVRFHPSGENFITADGKELRVYSVDGGEFTKKTQKALHRMTIRDVKFASDGKVFGTCSTDKTVKLWDFSSMNEVSTFDLKGASGYKTARNDFQVSLTFVDDNNLVSLGRSGDLNYLDKRTGKLERTVVAPTSSHQAVDVSSSGEIATISGKGEVLLYSATGEAKRVNGNDKQSKGSGIVKIGNDTFFSGRDKVVHKASDTTLSSESLSLDGPIKGMVKAVSKFAVTTEKSVTVFDGGLQKKVATLSPPGPIVCASISPDESTVYVCTARKKVHTFDMSGKEITGVFDIADGKPVSVTSSSGMVAVGLENNYIVVKKKGSNEAARFSAIDRKVTDISFSPSGKKLLAVTGTQGFLCVWSIENPKDNDKPVKKFQRVHSGGVGSARWFSEDGLYTFGKVDGSIKKWKL